jgi:hypothetical protein
MAFSDSAGEMSMLPRMIQLEASVVLAGVVPHPLAVRMNVRRFRMPGLIGEAFVGLRRRFRRVRRFRAMRWNRSADFLVASFWFAALPVSSRKQG